MLQPAALNVDHENTMKVLYDTAQKVLEEADRRDWFKRPAHWVGK
jgi:hypothetical protein